MRIRSTVKNDDGKYIENHGTVHGYEMSYIEYTRMKSFQDIVMAGFDTANNALAGIEFYTNEARFFLPDIYDMNNSDAIESYTRFGIDTDILM